MQEKVEAYCRYHELLKKGSGILVACSGGPDSLALLELMIRFSKRYKLKVAAAHFEHGIRGEDSLADAAFVADYCKKRQIPCFMSAADVPALSREQGISLELMARKLRYEFLEKTLAEQKLDYIAVAHHADDQAETVFMRILRGTGTMGLAAMRPIVPGGHIIRPLLGVTKQEIIAWCRQIGLKPRHDVTNDIPDCTRNKLRLELMPRLKQEFNEDITRGLCQLAAVAAAENDFLEAVVQRYWQDTELIKRTADVKGVCIAQAPFVRLPLAIKRRLLRRFWLALTGSSKDLSFANIELMLSLMEHGRTGSRQELPHKYAVEIVYGFLQGKKISDDSKKAVPLQTAVKIPGRTRFGNIICEAKVLLGSELPVKTQANEYYLVLSKAKNLVFRSRQPGDRMRLAIGHRKIKDILIDAKIARDKRDELPLLVSGSEVLWLVGYRRSSYCTNIDVSKKYVYFKIEKGDGNYHDA